MDEQHSGTLSDAADLNGEPTPQLDPNDFRETPQYSGNTEDVAPQQPEPGGTGVLDALREKGYEVDHFGSDEELIQETEARYAASLQAERNLSENQRALQRTQQENYTSEYAPAMEPEAPDSGKPKYDPAWSELVEQDSSGRFVLRQEYIGSVDPTVAENVNKYVAWRQDRSNQLIDDPVNAVMQAGLQDQIQRQIDGAVNSALSKSKMRNQAEAFIAQNAKTLYVQDPQTGTTQVDKQGSPVLSPVGRALNDAHVMLRKSGMADPVSRHRVATQMVQNYFTQQQLQQVQQNPQMQPNDHKAEYVSQPFAEPTNPLPPGYMPNTPTQPQANAIGADGLPEHTSLGSLATALAVHKGFLQPK